LELVAVAAGAAAFVSYHTDAWDLWRHTAPFALLIYLSMIVRSVEIGKDLMRAVWWTRRNGQIAG
jgi:hypothetical protein